MTEGIELGAPAQNNEIISSTPVPINQVGEQKGIMAFLKDKELPEEKPEINNTEEASKEEGDNEESFDSEKPESKVVKFKVGDQEIDIPEDSQIEIKVDGNAEQVSLADLKKNYSGKVAYDKKFQELHTMKTEFADNVKTIDRKLNDVFSTMKVDGMEGLRKLYKMGKIEDRFDSDIQQMQKQIEEMSTLSEEELNLKKERRKIEADREALKTEKDEVELTKGQKAIETYANKQMDDNGVSGREFQAASDAVLKTTPQDQLEKMTAEQLVNKSIELVLVERDRSMIDTVIKKVDATKVGDKTFFLDVLQIMAASKLPLDEENVEWTARELLGKQKPATSKENSTKATNQVTPGAPSKNNVAEDEDEDDVISLARGFMRH